MAEFFLRLSKASHPRTIVIFGPNHFSRGHTPVAVSILPWKTPFGLITPDIALAEQMMKEGLVQENEDAFYNEHSIGAIVPFIKCYFPDTRIVPIIVRPDTDTTAAGGLTRFVVTNSSSEVLFLASLDFSHYKTSHVAIGQDVVTYDILRRFDTANFRKTYVDSHIIFLTVLESSKLLGATDIVMVHHTNSGIIDFRPNEKCTSYMNMFLCQHEFSGN